MALPIIGNLLGGQDQNTQDQQIGPKKKGFVDNVAGVYNTLNNWRLTEWDRSMAALKGNLSQTGYYKSQEEQDVQKRLEQEKLDTTNTLLANRLMQGGDPETMRQEVMKIADWSKTPIGGDLVNKAMASIFKTQKPAVDNTRKEEDQLISDRAKLEDTTDETSTDILNNRIQNNPATKRYDQSAREELKNSIGDLNNTIGQANQYKGVDIPTIDIEGDQEVAFKAKPQDPNWKPTPYNGTETPEVVANRKANKRADGSEKANGWLGLIPFKDSKGYDSVMTEVSRAEEVNGRIIEYPLIVPTTTKDEIEILKKIMASGEGKIPASIEKKAHDFAVERDKKGLSPFASNDESPQGNTQPQPDETENDEALAWAKENPNDPKAKEILEILKQRGVN